MIAVQAVEHVLPLSGCRLRVLDLPDGGRVGQLYGPGGRSLIQASCEATREVNGWSTESMGRRPDIRPGASEIRLVRLE